MQGIIYFFCGLVLLLGGLSIMRGGLEKAARSRMSHLLERLAGSPARSFFTGAVITALVQSSTAITVITIGFVNAGVLNLAQAVGIVLGANVGTCLTTQLLSFDLYSIALPAAAAGLSLILFSKKPPLIYTGRALLGLGLIFFGLEALTDAFIPLHSSPRFVQTVSSTQSPWAAALYGCIFTGIIHSSATTTGVIMALSRHGLIDLPLAIAAVIGSNIGTCITAVLASMGGTATGKRVALAHVLLNLGGAALFLPLLGPFAALVGLTADTLPRQIANAQTIFNVLSSLLVLPFTVQFTRLLSKIK